MHHITDLKGLILPVNLCGKYGAYPDATDIGIDYSEILSQAADPTLLNPCIFLSLRRVG